MSVRVAATAVRTCFGDGPSTFAALSRGACGAAPLRLYDPAETRVTHGYEIEGGPRLFRASRWLTTCVDEALAEAGVDRSQQRVVVLAGTGLRELSAVEALATGGAGAEGFPAERLHFGPALTLAGACSAGGHALALAQDLLELGEADAVVAAGADAMTASMLAMIGRVAAEPTTRVRPFDRDRTGVLLGEGAAAVVLLPDDHTTGGPGPRVLATGLSCDAGHETAPDRAGILRAMRDAFARAGRAPGEVDLVVAHGTGTELNDPVEALALTELMAGHAPLVTAIKGAVGHTSGGSALLSLVMATYCMESGVVPHIVGLRDPLPEAAALNLVRDRPVAARPRLVQIDGFGFGGVNAVTLLEAT
ncbi:hypothetical protein N5079_23310 [Planotetraspora sp. A-T 1434]|uniref:beta-ketoacyl synthase N-terminal-like domain-containing protein n=1 Tax=Planotetraspora sp. A-T 1434 TaxID=2979219 RepID=UPI0021BDFF49|nr:beta-ketoacyl synthase N-terminal-like domain-containing protein [Planotetraspora sp. A-T 1434]MCT9933142.1 hypothetical protein [Planotetraspora sp. A-T 1434]